MIFLEALAALAALFGTLLAIASGSVTGIGLGLTIAVGPYCLVSIFQRSELRRLAKEAARNTRY